jgi:predicted AAA+ superfamily ATPase
LPPIYFSEDPEEDLKAYVGTYLKEEIAAEGLTRNVPAFSRFLEVAALCNGRLINFTKISNDAQVARTTVQEYFQILKDTLVAWEVTPWRKSRKRKPISTSKFYFFDPGIARVLQNRSFLKRGSPEFGEALETYMFHELKAYADYRSAGEICYWRSTSGFEVDFILAGLTAIEIKGSRTIGPEDLKGLRALQEERGLRRYVMVSLEEEVRRVGGIEVLPWREFLDRLWAGDFSK